MKNPSLIQFVLACLFFVVVVGFYVLLFGQVKKLSTESRTLAASIEEKSSVNSGTSASRVGLSELAESEAAIKSRFVATAGVVPFLESLESLASSLGASASVVSVSDPDATGRIEIALSITGSFESVLKTVGAIEYGPYGSATQNLALDVSDEGKWRAALVFAVVTPQTP